MLTLRNVYKKFGDNVVLNNVSLDVNKGDVVAILGPSGSGKTTLLRCAGYLTKADSGKLTLAGKEYDMKKISGKELREYRKRVGFVFQNFNLYGNKTALGNVTLGLRVSQKMPKAEAEEIGKKLLERVGLGVLEVEVVLPTLFSADLGGGERLGTLVEVAFTEAVEVHGDGLGALALAAIPDLRERDGDVDGGVLVDLVVLGRKSLGAEQQGGDGHDGDDGDHQHLLDLHVRSLLVPCCCSAQGSDSACSLPVPYTHHRTGSSHIRGEKI